MIGFATHIICMICIVCTGLNAQVNFILNGPSAELGGEIGAYAALPVYAPLGFYYNPAQLGFFAEKDMVSFSYPNYNNLGGFSNYATSFAAATGFKHNTDYDSIAIHFGLAYNHYAISYGLSGNESLETGSINETYNQVGLGVSFDYWVKLSLGLGLKSISARYGFESNSSIATDYGLLLSFPIFNFIYNTQNHWLNINMGYASHNNGASLKFENYNSPLPREQVAGISFLYGYNKIKQDKPENILTVAYSSEAHNPQYRSGFPTTTVKLDFMQHILKSAYEKDIYIKRTVKFGFFGEALAYSRHILREAKNFGDRRYNADTYMIALIKVLLMYYPDQPEVLKEIDIKFSLTQSRQIGSYTYYGLTLELYNFKRITDLFHL